MITMNNQIITKLYKNNDILFYLRTHPVWYKILNRHPQYYNQFEHIAKEDLKLTLNHKLDKIKNQVQLVGLLSEYMKSN